MVWRSGTGPEGLLDFLAQQTPDAVLIVRREDGAVVHANRAACVLYGCTPEELGALHLGDLLDGDFACCGMARLEDVARAGALDRQQHRRRDGSGFAADVNVGSGMLGGERVLVCMVRQSGGLERDGSESLGLAHRLQLLLESTDQGMYGTDLEERCTFVNRSAATLLGYEPWELVGKNMHQTVHGWHRDGSSYPAEACPLFRAISQRSGARVVGEVFRRKDGTCFPVEYSSYPVLEGATIKGAVVTFQDISERERHERAREAFLHAVSHDLRGPLAVIRGHAQLLQALLDKLDQQGIGGQMRHSADAIVTGTGRMAAIIRDLLDAARLELGQLHVELHALDPGSFVGDLLDRMAGGMSDSARIELDAAEDLPAVLADPDQLERVCTNLLSNAMKYSAPGTPLKVRVSREGSTVLVSISDQGPGISPTDLPHLFDLYYQAGDRSQYRGVGLGLGLYVVRRLMEAMGGRVWAESEVGRGSTFHIALPGFDPDST